MEPSGERLYPMPGEPAWQPGMPGPGQIAGQPDDDGPSATSLWVLRLAKAIVFLIYAAVAVSLAMLALAFVMRLFGASTDAEFTRWVYRSVDRIMDPFRGMFPSPTLSDRSVVDFSLLFAMIVYSIVALCLHTVVSWVSTQISRTTRRRQRPPAYGVRRPSPPYNA